MHNTNPVLDLTIIESLLETQAIGRAQGSCNELWDELESTNDRAIALAHAGAGAGVIVLSRSQTAGRGRLGRTWHSPPEAGLYMSVLLRPKFLPTSLPLVTLGAGVAVANATELITGVKLGLKWVNDLVVAGGKVGGILAEFQQEPPSAMSHIPKMGASLVLGIGLNICQGNAKLPSELTTKMRWLEAISHKPVDRNRLVCQIAFEIEQMLEILSSGNIQAVLDAWRKRSVTLGAAVKSQANSETIAGQAIDITNSGSLIIQTPQGVRQLHAGEVSVRKLDGSYY